MSIRCDTTVKKHIGEIRAWQQSLISRRRFLLGLAGGSLLALFPFPKNSHGESPADTADPWEILAAVQNRLFPSEPHAPGAREIQALNYLRFIVDDEKTDGEERDFILKGTQWLEAMSIDMHRQPFSVLSDEQQEELLKRITRSDAGENWLSTLLLYIFEALLSDPVYGGNPNGIGWKWLQHQPGFPRPTQAGW